MEPNKPVINCHTHIFTGDHVPPFLAKTFVLSPLHFLLPLSLVVKLFRWWYNVPYRWQFRPRFKKAQLLFYKLIIFAGRNRLSYLFNFAGIILFIHVFYILVNILTHLEKPGVGILKKIDDLKNWLIKYRILHIPDSFTGKLLLVLVFILFFKSGRNILLMILKNMWSFLKMIPGPNSRALALRYLKIGRYAFYLKQSEVLKRLRNQYPQGTGFVILPMDMEYMEAGKLKKGFHYHDQMAALAEIKKRDTNKSGLFPFVFADPRRIKEEGELHFKYSVDNDGKIVLGECFIKTYIEQNEFSGFKIYPALGYYPFDECLLPLWKYAADNELPILTHCIRGTIFFRGSKKKEWDTHPVFEQAKGNNEYIPLLLPEISNSEFINNFTHPLNYLCLLDERLLRKLVQKAKDERIRQTFGYIDESTKLKYDLSKLKLCFGHYGGDDEWSRFLEMDRDNYSSQLVRNPSEGISFLDTTDEEEGRGKPEQIWKYADWYSIISSMMLQYDNVYADLSYIIHNPAIQPLLKQTMLNKKLFERTLFGTDFYVVRNHKSEKNMLADCMDNFTVEEFDQIARINPRKFLYNKFHGAVKI